MKQGLVIFAKGVIFLVGIGALSVCVILLPELTREEAVGKPFNPYVTYGGFGVVYILTIPFFIALYQTFKFLNLIEKGRVFSKKGIEILSNIKSCAIIFSILIVLATIAGITISKSIDPSEDVTFMVPIGITFLIVSAVIAVFVAVLQKLLDQAVELKSENDLII